MELLRNLRERLEGCDEFMDYGHFLDRLRCTFYEDPYSFIDSRLLSCCFAKKSQQGHILAACCESGQIIILNTKLINVKNNNCYTISELHKNAVFSSAWSDIDMKLVTASGDHTVKLWDVQDDGKLKELNDFSAHRRSVKTSCFQPRSSDIFATGGRDGNIFVWDARSNKREPEQSIIHCHPKIFNKRESGSVTWLTYQDDVKLISCADVEANINIWDLRKTYLRTMDHPKALYQLKPKEESVKGYSHMAMNKNGTELYANRFNSKIYTFNLSTYHADPELTYSGHSVTTCYNKISLSPDEKYLAGCDDMNRIYIWRLKSSSDPFVVLGGPNLVGLSDIAWSPEDPLMLASSSDDPFPWIWTVPEDTDDRSVQPPQVSDGSDSTFPECSVRSFALRLCKKIPPKVKRKYLMYPRSLMNTSREELSSMLMLPNTIVDGYQTHVCVEVEKRRILANNWLTNIHDQQTKKILFEKQTRKGVKRKRSMSMSPCNNLIKYLKRTNENTPMNIPD